MRYALLLAVFLMGFSSHAQLAPQPAWQQEMETSYRYLMQNLRHPGVGPGVVIASPSQRDPDYFFHWVRDAALVMGTLLDLAPWRPEVGPQFGHWLRFENYIQEKALTGPGLGEPKFMVNGDLFTGPWGRPQNDGPAIRAWAALRGSGQMNRVVERDLEYLRREWTQPDFDLWEEVKGYHFFTRYAQMAAFRQASQVLLRQNPAQARQEAALAQQIESSLGAFVDRRFNSVAPTLPGSEGVQKVAGLDTSVILAILYFGPTPNWSVTNPYVINTMYRLEEVFSQVYSVNRTYTDMAPGIGRYPEDVYDGNGFGGGNPWFLTTFAAAEYYCTLVRDLSFAGVIRLEPLNLPFYEKVAQGPLSAFSQLTRDQDEYWRVLSGLQNRAHSFIQRALFHVGPDRRYAEQFDRVNGFRRGARDLTWSYAASLRAFQRCQANSPRNLR